MCVLTQRPGQPETSQRVEGAHDGSDGSDPHRDGVMVGVLWAFWEAPRLHQQKVFHSADTQTFIDLLDKTRPFNTDNFFTSPHSPRAPVGILERVGCRQISSKVVSQQHHLLQAHLLPPLLQGFHKLLLSPLWVGAEQRAAASAEAQQV